jgi:hypothetical protein
MKMQRAERNPTDTGKLELAARSEGSQTASGHFAHDFM